MSHDPHADPDMLRPTECAVHYWQAVDRHEDVYRCRWCHLTWSPDDDEPDSGGRAA